MSSNLPAPPQSFVDRHQEVDELTALLLGETSRLVTITGPGGTGKTRTAIQTGRRVVDALAGGCWYVDLSDARSSTDVASAVAAALGVPLTLHGAAEQSIANILQYRPPLLLVLDNFEQVVAHADKTVGYWRKQAPQIRFLVTSRIVLGLAGEQEFELGPLPKPALDRARTLLADDVLAYYSVQLFVDRAREVKPDFRVTDESAAAVARICAELEGMPLSLELAAARIKILAPQQIAERLGQRFELLKSSRRDLPARQRTLLGAIDWSFDLLSEWEKHAFMQVAVFRGGFELEDAEAVLDLARFAEAPLVMDVLQGLREKSLIRAVETDFGMRFTVYIALRDYAELKWREIATGEMRRELEERHARRFMQKAEELNTRFEASSSIEALDRMQQDIENLFVAAERSLAAGHAEVAARVMLALRRVLHVRGPVDQLVPRLEGALAALGENAVDLRVCTLVALSEAREIIGPWEQVVAHADLAVMLAAELPNELHRAAALDQQGKVRCLRGNFADGIQCFAASEEIYRRQGHQRGIGGCLQSRGNVFKREGNLEKALECFETAERIAEQCGDRMLQVGVINNTGLVHLQRGEYGAALTSFTAAARIAKELKDLQRLPMCMSNQGSVFWARGEYAKALDVYREAERVVRSLGNKALLTRYVGNQGIMLMELGQLEEALERFAEAEKIARELGHRQVTAWHLMSRGDVHFRKKEYSQALSCFAQAEKIFRETTSKAELVQCLNSRARALADAGDAKQAVSVFEEAETGARAIRHKSGLADSLAGRGQVYLSQGKTDEARALMREVLALYDEMDVTNTRNYFAAKTQLAQAEEKLGNRAAASKLAGEALKLAEKLGIVESGDHEMKTRVSLLRAIVPEIPAAEPVASGTPARQIDWEPPSHVATRKLPQDLPTDEGRLLPKPSALLYAQDPLVGKVLGGCEILALLGRGAMGAVYKARQVSVDRTVALKVMLPDLFQDQRYIDRFLREAKTIARFRSPYVVQVHEVGTEQGIYFLVMEFVDGGDLGRYTQSQPEGRLPPKIAERFLGQACEALLDAESLEIVHRDLKPANLLLDRGRSVKIADFGIARLVDATRITATQQMLGTPLYMSPEQFRGSAVDRRCDMYCLGATFYHLITAQVPFTGASVFEVLRHKEETPCLSPARVLGDKVSPRLNAVIERLTATRVEDRYHSFSQALEELSS